jgi:hypothetical protein
LYFHLLLARLEARGEIGRPSFEWPPRTHQTGPHPGAEHLR